MSVNDINVLRAKFTTRYQVLPNGCWFWLAAKTENGYGKCWFSGKLHQAHRISLFLFKGFDLYSPELGCHNCDNQFCVNPDHLFIGTHQDNVDDCIRKGRFHGMRQSNKPRPLDHTLLRGRRGDYQIPCRGSDNPRVKLNESDVIWIRQNYRNPYSAKELAEKYSVNSSTITRIANGKRWKHLPLETQ